VPLPQATNANKLDTSQARRITRHRLRCEDSPRQAWAIINDFRAL
jgi:hypothetical protein